MTDELQEHTASLIKKLAEQAGIPVDLLPAPGSSAEMMRSYQEGFKALVSRRMQGGQQEMSVEFEMEAEGVDFCVDAYTNEAFVCAYNLDREGHGAGTTFTGDQIRQLRRFLEWCYPAHEDPPHDSDPWLQKTTWPQSIVWTHDGAKGPGPNPASASPHRLDPPDARSAPAPPGSPSSQPDPDANRPSETNP
jgi:hypothetical protein